MINYKSEKTYRLGMRNLKTAIAVLICLVLGRYARTENSFYMVVAAMLSMETSVVNSFEIGKNRVLGTVMGALLAMAFSYWAPGSLALSILGVVAIIYVCNLLKWNKTTIMASFVFLGIMLEATGESVFWYGVHRTVDSLMGLGIGLAVNYLIFPYSFEKTLDEKTQKIKMLINKNLDNILCNEKPAELEPLKEALESYETEIGDYRAEAGVKKRHEEDLEQRAKILEDLYGIFTHLKVLENIDAEAIDSREHSVYTYHKERLQSMIRNIQGLEGLCDREKPVD